MRQAKVAKNSWKESREGRETKVKRGGVEREIQRGERDEREEEQGGERKKRGSEESSGEDEGDANLR